MKIKTHYLRKITSWLLPYVCILCKQSSDQFRDLCYDCQLKLPLLTYGCDKCAIPLPQSNLTLTCGYCLNQSPPFDSTHALFLYQPPITKLVLALKFSHSLVNARILGELLADAIKTDWYQCKPVPDLIIPVPLHPERLKERGFNQALELARPISKLLKIPVDTYSCRRIKNTAAQATLSGVERQKNIKAAFEVIKPLKNQHIAVIDDVITTGHTIREFCGLLKKNGAKRIDVWCCARPLFSV